jgi:hypothetical protein
MKARLNGSRKLLNKTKLTLYSAAKHRELTGTVCDFEKALANPRRLGGTGEDILGSAEFASGHGATCSILTLGKSTFFTVRVFGSNSNKSARSAFLYLAASIAASSIEKWMLGFSVGQTMQSIKAITKNQIFICPPFVSLSLFRQYDFR